MKVINVTFKIFAYFLTDTNKSYIIIVKVYVYSRAIPIKEILTLLYIFVKFGNKEMLTKV